MCSGRRNHAIFFFYQLSLGGASHYGPPLPPAAVTDGLGGSRFGNPSQQRQKRILLVLSGSCLEAGQVCPMFFAGQPVYDFDKRRS